MKNLLLSVSLMILCAGVILTTGPGCNTDNNTTLDPGTRVRSSAKLNAFGSCGELEAALKKHVKEEMRTRLLSLDDYYIFVEVPEVGDDGDTAAGGTDKGREEGVDYSGTNNQEAGVDEADIVKTDGYAIYVLSGNRFITLEVPEFGLLDNGTSLEIEGSPGQMLIRKQTSGGHAVQAVVFSSIYAWSMAKDHPLHSHIVADNATSYRCYGLTKITVIDLSDTAHPEVVRELYLEGSYQTARRVDSAVHMIAYTSMEVPGLTYWPELPDEYYQLPHESPRRRELWDEAIQKAIAENNQTIDALELADLVPLLYEVGDDNSVTPHDFTTDGCSNFITAADGMSRGFTSILSLDLLDEDLAVESDHIVSNQSIVYSSSDTLIIAEPAQDSWWFWGVDGTFDEATNIHRFDISETGKAAYRGSGRVDGTVLNQFALSEYNDYIRVAATTGRWSRWWLEEPDEPENFVYVLEDSDNNSLDIAGQTDALAKGERIWSARFVEDRAYLVTFRNIDPLWTIDLSDPGRPEIMGELEVPGVSTYIHPLNDDFLLTIGYGGDDEGLDWSVQVSLFDVSDFDNATLADSLILAPPAGDGWESWASSEALYEHKAFQYWAAKKLLAVPLSTFRYHYESGPGFYSYYYEYLSKLELISVDTAAGLSLYGSIDHSGFYNKDNDVYWCNMDIRRSIFMGDYIYAIGDRAVTAGNLDNMTITGSVELPGSDCGYYYLEGSIAE